ncbi:MAG: single-stranded-DNA-specific exonuclease RecJ [Sphingobacteriales bacterium SCN 48-20]|uniref:single-stranded-DNA-specific exonuclease RecJ n=1 Tax=Terrimonas ferruginea TaxID=249 RepID=UPI0008690079|nr:single-stranded-DNA-specific exonuclease RecJ [Terrimonas ferruginea]MBN8781675.1 single-stranded-DNA-specific exonuclease RecJ [Terrimonas ferruginea]ODT93269.1 MAG: single-stranded-DNA-specific exonuclease RecJ [Sphingobacteriales bacterium SCN 48-20]OJW45197.1 MAG: single-stranded-DNA-specific exonuclease RecJ [Sphingobacteriales bacterium 48-107]
MALQRSLGIHPVICSILVQRGINTFEEARSFFRPQLTDLHDPWLMKDMQKAVDRILQAKEKQEKILVFGDYDVDGTTAVACMYRFLKKIHEPLDFYIPHRYREGYGVSKAGIDHAHANGFTLIISVDCGIKSADLIAYAKELGIDFIVCDHHLPDEQLPPAVAILNPKQKDCPYPFKELCGCGVGFKLMSALTKALGLPPDSAMADLDLLATAIAADIVDMADENRILAYYGLQKANRSPNFGIKALTVLSALRGTLNISNLVFMIAPRVNAAGRMDDARKAVQLFISDTYEEALRYAEMLHSDNSDRKEADSSITTEALELIRSRTDWTGRSSTLVFQPHWHKGVVGIVASRLIEHYHRPTIVLTQSGDYAAGSARSVPGFNLYEAIHACREHLLGYGGHFAAAGMTLELDKVELFREKFEEVVAATIHPDMLIPEIVIDHEIRLRDITPTFYNIICQMEPFGPQNLRPVFVVRHVFDTGASRILKETHLRVAIRQEHATITGIGFGMAHLYPLLENGKPVDIVFTIDENEWNGEKNLQLRLIDVRAAAQAS